MQGTTSSFYFINPSKLFVYNKVITTQLIAAKIVNADRKHHDYFNA